MAYLHEMFLKVKNMAYHGNGKFTGTCGYSTNGGSCLEMIVKQRDRGSDEQYYPWHGEFRCTENCSNSKILSNLHMRGIFYDPKSCEEEPEIYHCLFNQYEAKEFLKEEVNFICSVLQKPEATWEKELKGYDLRFLRSAIYWFEEVGRYCFSEKIEVKNKEKDIKDDDLPF
jgi:hypothetical protein